MVHPLYTPMVKSCSIPGVTLAINCDTVSKVTDMTCWETGNGP